MNFIDANRLPVLEEVASIRASEEIYWNRSLNFDRMRTQVLEL